MLIDTYTLIVKKSKFIALYYEVTEIEQVKKILEELKKEHRKARHLPYAYKIGVNVKKSDDKEPSNTAGFPILNVIEKNNLDNVLIVVIRYFGGIKLGTGGLFRAYGMASREVVKKQQG